MYQISWQSIKKLLGSNAILMMCSDTHKANFRGGMIAYKVNESTKVAQIEAKVLRQLKRNIS